MTSQCMNSLTRLLPQYCKAITVSMSVPRRGAMAIWAVLTYHLRSLEGVMLRIKGLQLAVRDEGTEDGRACPLRNRIDLAVKLETIPELAVHLHASRRPKTVASNEEIKRHRLAIRKMKRYARPRG